MWAAVERASLPPPQSLWRDRSRGRGKQGTDHRMVPALSSPYESCRIYPEGMTGLSQGRKLSALVATPMTTCPEGAAGESVPHVSSIECHLVFLQKCSEFFFLFPQFAFRIPVLAWFCLYDLPPLEHPYPLRGCNSDLASVLQYSITPRGRIRGRGPDVEDENDSAKRAVACNWVVT